MRRLHLVHSASDSRDGDATEIAGSDRRPTDVARADLASGGEVDPLVQALLDHVRIIAPLPRFVRARALARARAVVADRRSRANRRSRS